MNENSTTEYTQHESRAICSVNHCPQPATITEKAESEHWRIVINYCDEHAREIDKGTPLGPVGLDPARLEVTSRGTEETKMPNSAQAIGPH